MANSVVAFPTEIQMPVEVIGCDLFGLQFFESTETVTISRGEVSLLLTCKLAADTEVILRNPETDEEASAIVVEQLHESGAGHVYGLIFLDPAVNLWHIKFPPTDEPKIVPLACGGCHQVIAQSLTEADALLLESARELRRLCQKCNSITLWKYPASAEPPKQSPIPISIVSTKEERRKSRRTAMRMTACIRSFGMSEVVACEDISKGGFRFTCRKEYPEGTPVEVAVPYEQSTTNIYSPAVIKYCIKLSDGRFRHGVAHVKNSSSYAWDS
jgi:hypothetical protein